MAVTLGMIKITQKDDNFSAARSAYNITTGACQNATTEVSTTATTTLSSNPNATATYRAICNKDIGISSPNSAVFVKSDSTSTDEATGFLLNLGDCLEMYPQKWLPITEMWAVATTGSTTITTIECGN